LSNAMYEYMNMEKSNENTLRRCFSNDFFIDFGLLRCPYCKISYLLSKEH